VPLTPPSRADSSPENVSYANRLEKQLSSLRNLLLRCSAGESSGEELAADVEVPAAGERMPKKPRDHRWPDVRRPRRMGSLSELLGVRMRRVDILLTQLFDELSPDLMRGAITCLSLIAENPGMSQTDLAQSTGFDKSMIVSIVDQLEQHGWAVRERSTVDRRRHSLSATAEGRRKLEEVGSAVKGREALLLSHLSDAERDQLGTLLDKAYASCISNLDDLEAFASELAA
jgi:DNA-binding MarR family transcriptional regulator